MAIVENPLVSVLMTAYNREKYIAESIESVLASTYINFELIIVDDCSADNTVSIAKTYEVKDSRVKVYVNELNLTDYVNRNKAAGYAKGKYIKYVDSDDLIYFHCLEVMVRFMEQCPEAGFGMGTKREDKVMPFVLSPKQIYLSHFTGARHFDRGPLGAIIKFDAFNAVGGFSGARFVGDMELWMNLSRYYDMVVLPNDLFYYRTHVDSESAIESRSAKEIYKKRKNFILTSLAHPDCPLNKEEIYRVRKLYSRSEIKNKIFSRLISFKKLFQIIL
jgi:glycosyltransferase involved in cell wall biosynthesis